MDSISDQDVTLQIAEMLWKRRASITLDEVDGTFYWRKCRRADIPSEFSMFDEFPLENLIALHEESPDWFRWITPDQLPPMRPAWIRTMRGGTEYPNDPDRRRKHAGSLFVGIRSSSMNGADVANCVYQFDAEVRDDPDYASMMPDPEWPDDYDAVNIRAWLQQPGSFEFTEHPALRSRHYRDGLPTMPSPKLAFPFVLLEIHYPLPPQQVITAFYDAYVMERRQWHRELVGSVNRQSLEVAIRTWAVALLMAAGRKHYLAMSDVCGRLGIDGVSQPRYGQDRELLMRRVPELKKFIERVNP